MGFKTSSNSSNSQASQESAQARPKPKPKFRIQQAILILRQGKSHPQWREAAWHLMEHAGKDTQLLLEAQRDLIENAQPQDRAKWAKYLLIAICALGVISLLSALVWRVAGPLKLLC